MSPDGSEALDALFGEDEDPSGEAPSRESVPAEAASPEEEAGATSKAQGFVSSAAAASKKDPGESTDELTFTSMPKPEDLSQSFRGKIVGKVTGEIPLPDFDEDETEEVVPLASSAIDAGEITSTELPLPDFEKLDETRGPTKFVSSAQEAQAPKAGGGPDGSKAELERALDDLREINRGLESHPAPSPDDARPEEKPIKKRLPDVRKWALGGMQYPGDKTVDSADFAAPDEPTMVVDLHRSGRGTGPVPEKSEESFASGLSKEPPVNVDDVLEALERRVRDTPAPKPAAEPPLETSEGARAPAPAAGAHALVGGIPRPAPGTGDSGAYPLTFIQESLKKDKNPYIEPIDIPELPKAPTQRAGAIEIARERIRYLELRPDGNRVVAVRFEDIPLGSVPAESSGAWGQLVAQALAGLAKRLDGLPPVNVLVPQSSIGAKVATMAISTRRIERAVLERMAASDRLHALQDTTSERKLLRNIRIGSQVWKSVLVTSSRRAEIDWLANLLRSAQVAFVRMTTSHLAFLEKLVFLGARMDEDAVEAFVYTDPTTVTIAFPARGVLLRADSLPVKREYAPDSPEFVGEIVSALSSAWNELKREFGFQEISRVRYLSAWPGSAFPSNELADKLGRPTEPIDPDSLLRIDLESTEALGVPPDAVAALGAAALDAMVAEGGLDLSSRSADAGRARLVAWLADAAAAVLVSAAIVASGSSERARFRNLSDDLAARNKRISEQPRLQEEKEALARARDARERIEREAPLLAKVARRPDLRSLLAELGRKKPDDIFVNALRVHRDSPDAPWSLVLEGVAVADSSRSARIGDAFADSVLGFPLLDGANGRARRLPGSEKSSIEVSATLRPANGER